MVLNHQRTSAASCRAITLSIVLLLVSACGAVDDEVSCGDTIFGANTGSPNIVGDNSGDVVYEFELDERQAVVISTCLPETGFDTRLRLFSDELLFDEIAEDDDGGGCDRASEISTTLSSGTYYIVVEGFGSQEGNFGMSVGCADPELDSGAIAAIVFGVVVACCCVCGCIARRRKANQRSNQSRVAQQHQPPQQQQMQQPVYAAQPQPVYTGQPQPQYTGQPQPVYTGQPQPVYTGQPQQSRPEGVPMQGVVSSQAAVPATLPSSEQPGAASFQPPPSSNPSYSPDPDEPPPPYEP